MGKLERLEIWWQDEGVIGIAKALWVAAIYLTPCYGVCERVLGDELHEQCVRAPRLGYWPTISEPQTFNEKLLHRKLHTDDPLFSVVSDKWEARRYVEECLGPGILNEVYHHTSDAQTIPFDDLPERYVVKANHGCGWNIFVENNGAADREQIRSECERWLNRTYGGRKREYWYEDIEPTILVERYIESDRSSVPRDYKFFVFDGRVEYIEVDFDRFSDHTRRFFDREWSPQEFRLEFPLGPIADPPPDLEEMIHVAETLGEPFDAIRVDLYNPRPGSVVFGEITVAHGAGGEKFIPDEVDHEFGAYWPMDGA